MLLYYLDSDDDCEVDLSIKSDLDNQSKEDSEMEILVNEAEGGVSEQDRRSENSDPLQIVYDDGNVGIDIEGDDIGDGLGLVNTDADDFVDNDRFEANQEQESNSKKSSWWFGGRKPDPIRQEYVPVRKNVVKCKYCQKEVTERVERMRKHIQGCYQKSSLAKNFKLKQLKLSSVATTAIS